jgi:hypothetical protein
MTDIPITPPIAIVRSDLSMVDNASLTFFTNPAYHGLLQRKQMAARKNNADEIKFYRKRIVALFKELSKEPETVETSELKEMHSLFVNAAIRYFEMTDKKDIVQGQHGIQGTGLGQAIDETNVSLDDLFGEADEKQTIAQANDLMTRKTIVIANLDNYVISKDTSANEVRIIPLKMDIDLKTNDLKTKGLMPKKSKQKAKQKEQEENIDNV